MLIKTDDGKKARCYAFKDGRVFTKKGNHPGMDFSLVWKDAAVGRNTLISMVKGNRKALVKAIMNGNLKLEGDAGSVTWFMKINNRMMKHLHEFVKKGFIYNN